MPVVRSLRGGRSPFSPAKISSTISKAYQAIYQGNTVRYRKAIQEHTQRVIEGLRLTLGKGQHAEWSREAIATAIEAELRDHAPTAVHGIYLHEHPEATPLRPEEWDRVEPMPRPEEIPPSLSDDPVWTILWPKEEVTPEVLLPTALHDLGREVLPKSTGKPTRHRTPPVRRSLWLAFWEQLANTCAEPLDVTFLMEVVRRDRQQHAMTTEGWWRHWQGLFDQALQAEPRLIHLLAAARRRRVIADVLGVSWLAGTPLSSEAVTWLEGEEGQQRYRALWVRHMLELNRQKKLRAGLISRFRLKELAQLLIMERDAAIDWRGWECLETAGALWPIPAAAWESFNEGAHEFPQWAFLRLAMDAAADETDPDSWVQRFYEALSLRQVVTVDAVREAGKPEPDFLEDQTGRVGDDFEAIYDAIHLAAVATKWNGTVALDWRQVRAKGASIANRRTSQGVISFWRSLDQGLAAQGRQGIDRPVTVALPLWHREALDLLDLRDTQAPGFNRPC
jgi:hypothetical protein